MMIMVVIVVTITTVLCTNDLDEGWIAVQHNDMINYDLENSPLQIQTDSEVGSYELVKVYFYNAGTSFAGGVFLFFSSHPWYRIIYCTTYWHNFSTDLPSETDKVWTISLTRTAGKKGLVITCNDKEVLNVILSYTTCAQSGWSNFWNKDVKKIQFISSDTASDYYRPGWTAVKSNVPINYDIEKSPLQIKTNSQVGSDEKIYDVSFYNAAGNDAGGVFLNFSSPPQYWLYGCSLYYTNFPTALPSETDNKVWTLTKTTGIHRVVIHCNDKEVLNVVLSDTTCNESDWRTMWMRDVEMINFPSCCDTTYYYRPAPDCTGLKTEWTSTIITTKQFPVDPGTVMEVTCSNADAVNEGSSEVTCTTGTVFIFSVEPNCMKKEHTCTALQVTNGTVSPDGVLKQNTVVTVTCSKRYVLIGHKEVTCQSTGWNPKQWPVCKKCSKFDFKHTISVFLFGNSNSLLQ